MKKIYPFYSLLILSLILSTFFSFGQTKIIPYQELATSSGSPTGSGMFFGATMTTSNITISFEGPADRWIALGFGSSMVSTDVLMYSNGHAISSHPLGWYDYFNSSYNSSGVLVDAIQNWTIVSTNTTSAGNRTITASRVLSTGDANDVAFNFTATALSLVWARGSSADYTVAYHGSTNRASGITLTWLSAPTASFTSSTTSLCEGSSLTYSNISQGGLTSYSWSFSGGSPATSTSTNPSVSYSVPGTYPVSLIAVNAVGSNTLTQTNYITISPTIAPSVSIGLSSGSNPMCSGSSISFSSVANNGGTTPIYQWKINGVNVGTNSSSFTSTSLINSSSVTCVMTSNAQCPSPSSTTSTPITVTVNSTAPATVSVSLLTGNNPICLGETVVFDATAGNGGANPVYQWKINGSNVGTNTNSFTTNSLSNGDVVSCQLGSNSPCASNTLAISSGITMSVSSILSPSVSVSIVLGANPACAGNSLTFSATPNNGGTSPGFQWKVNGIGVGNNSPVFTSANIPNAGVVTCEMTSGLSCSNPSMATSAALNMTIHAIPSTPTITPSGLIGLCAGNTLILTSSAASGNVWSNSSTSNTVAISSPGNYSVMQTTNGCSSDPSAIVTITTNPQPTATLSPAGPFCNDSESLILLGSPAGGTYSGSGIAGSVFVPSLATVGSNVIVYHYSDANNCVATASTSIMVLVCSGLTPNTLPYNDVLIFPNPGNGIFNLQANIGKIRTVSISDVAGRSVFRKTYDNETNLSFDITKEPDGVYILEISTEIGTTRTRITKKD